MYVHTSLKQWMLCHAQRLASHIAADPLQTADNCGIQVTDYAKVASSLQVVRQQI